MLQQPRRNLTGRQRNGRKGRAVWLEVPYEAVLGWLSVRNIRIYGGERSVDAKYSSIGKGVVKIIQLFPTISPSHPSLSVRRVAALQCGGNLLTPGLLADASADISE
jgi:hypothetical protein